MPVFATLKAKQMTAYAFDRTRINILNLDCIITISGWTPAKQSVALQKKNGQTRSNFNCHTLLTSTKLLVIRCWYRARTLISVTSRITVTSSTNISQSCAAHAMDWPRPSSVIFVVRYSVQHAMQNLCPHSSPVIICSELGKLLWVRFWKLKTCKNYP